MRAIILKKPGDPSNLLAKDVDPPKTMSKNDIYIRHTYLGINFDDILSRQGAWELPKNDNKHTILGLEGVGVIEKVGSGITRFNVGQRIGYAFSPIGAYCEKRVINANYCVAIPDEIPDDHAAAILRKGLAAHTMLFRCHVPRKNQTILVTGAGGGIGYLLARWAKYSGVKVIGVIGQEAKRESALSSGCDIVINYTHPDAIDQVADFTENRGVHAVYDGVGSSVFDFCIKALHIFGTYISYGNTSGNIINFNPTLLEGKSLFFTKPRFELYKGNRNELVISTHELFDAYKKGAVAINVIKYDLNNIPTAHKDIEARKVAGAAVAKV